MKNLKDFKKFAIDNKTKSVISGGYIAPDPCDDCGNGSGGGGGGTYTPPKYCCGGNPSSICGSNIHYAKVYCRTNGLPEPIRVN